MYCKKCGIEIDDDSVFCFTCGSKQRIELSHPSTHVEEEIISKPKRSKNVVKKERVIKYPSDILEPTFDPMNKQDYSYVIVVCIWILIWVLFYINQQSRVAYPKDYYDTSVRSNWPIYITLCLRIGFSFWIAALAKSKNRQRPSWALLGFFFPIISSIILGLSKKLFLLPTLNPHHNPDDNFNFIIRKAYDLYNENRDEECIRFCRRALSMKPNNKEAVQVLNLVMLKLLKRRLIKSDSGYVVKNYDGETISLLIKEERFIGSQVLINNSLAEDGIYFLPGIIVDIVVRQGKIESVIESTNYGEFRVLQNKVEGISVLDKVLDDSGALLADGKYTNPALPGYFIVDNGRVIKLTSN